MTREALEIQRRVLGPEHPNTAVSIYNLAIIALHEGKLDETLLLLQGAVDHGLGHSLLLGIEKDPDLKALHGDPRFPALVAYAKQRAAAMQKPK